LHGKQLFIAKTRFYSSVTILYIGTLLFLWYALSPVARFNKLTIPIGDSSIINTPLKPIAPDAVTGRPVRIVIPTANIDLQIDKGEYNPNDNSWTLSNKNAQFAMPTSLANNQSGNTFIYGHNSKAVFGTLPKVKPGDKATVYTDEHRTFTYTFVDAENVKPEDTSVLLYKGPPIMTIQTCSGSLNEWRRMFTFKFDNVRSEKI
jgi:LPXTG-site transpeptidase (sortase) family protein